MTTNNTSEEQGIHCFCGSMKTVVSMIKEIIDDDKKWTDGYRFWMEFKS